MRKNMRKRILSGVLVAGLGLALAAPVTTFAKVTKQESVYVIAEPDGAPKTVTVSDQLQGAASESGTLKDVSELTDIKNVKGDETFEQNGQNITWNLNGADIFYQGKTDKKLPVSVNITYELDGKKTEAKDLLGKSGKLKIHVAYENHTGTNKEINGKKTKIVTPFLMATGLILDNEHFTDVNLDAGGKVIDDGSKSIVICLGMPGLKESLNLSKKIDEKIGDKLKDEFTVTCQTTNFEMKNTFTFASANLLNSIMDSEDTDPIVDLDKIDGKVDDLDKAVDKLDKGTGDLKDGANKLSDGASELTKGLKKYVDTGVKKLTAGIRTLGSKAPKLKKGVGDYVDGVDKMSDGVKAYVTGAGKLTDGIKKIGNVLGGLDTSKLATVVAGIQSFAEGIAGAVDQDELTKLSTGAKGVSDAIGTVNEGLTTLKDSFSNNDEAITAMETALAANEKVLEGLKAAKEAGAQGLDTSIAALTETTAGQKKAIEGLKTITATQKAGIEKLETATASSGELATGAAAISGAITKLTTAMSQLADSEGVQSIKGVIQMISTSLPIYLEGAKKLVEGANKLSENDKALLSGADKLKGASRTMRSSIDKLGDGMTKLNDGADKLDKASDTLVSGADKLNDGTTELFKGAKKLNDGFSKFRSKAIDKLLDFYHNDIRDLVDSLSEVIDAGKDYKSFSGISDQMDGEAKFIIETEAVKADE